MKITFLGTGSSIPAPKTQDKPFRSYAGLLIEIGEDKLLFDPGPGSLVKLQQLGIDTRVDPSHVFLTHLHLDHCEDVPALMKGRSFDIQTGEQIQGAPVIIYGPQGTFDLFSKGIFTQRWEYMHSRLDFLPIKEIKEGNVVSTNNWHVSCIPIKHYDGVAYKILGEGKTIIYSGDMAYDENIVTLGKNADMAILECSFPSRTTLQGLHLCPEDIGKLAKLGNFKQTYLTHLYPTCEGKETEMMKEIESLSDTKVTVAYDFLQVEI